MKRVYSVYEAKAKLSEIIHAVRERGETVTVSYHGEPVAEIRPVSREDATTAERIADLEARGVIAPAPDPGAKLSTAAGRRPGALKRFLEERDNGEATGRVAHRTGCQTMRVRDGFAVLSIIMCAACGPRRVDTGGALPPGDHEISLRHDGRTRHAIVHVPQRNHGSSRALVIAFHGGGGEAGGFKRTAGLDAIADREGFVVVYPYGTGRLPRRLLTFNAGDTCCGYALDNNVDDVGFAIALIDELARRVNIDTRRVYATGHSNGGVMSHRLAAERAERIAAIAPVAGALNSSTFAPAVPVPVLHIHSVDDPRALYNGGLGPPFPMTNRRVMHKPVRDGLAQWAERNGCTDETTVNATRRGEPGTINARHTATLLVWVGCTGAPLEHWRLEGVGHAWPGVAERENEELVGPPTTIINAAEEAWRFFQRFER